MAENAEKTFEPYLLLSLKNRMKIMDKLEPDDRCRFVRCSKSSSAEAKASKNYIYKLKLEVLSQDSIQISVMYGFHLTFFERYKLQSNLYHEEQWTERLNDIPDLQFAVEEFKNRLYQCQNVVRKLSIVDDKRILRGFDLRIESLNNVEELVILADIEPQQILSKLHRPLSRLHFSGLLFTQELVNCPQLYQVRDSIRLRGSLQNEHFVRLTAKSVTMPIGNLSEHDIFQFIRAWQNGTIGKEIEFYQWCLENSNFNVQKLARLLRFRREIRPAALQIVIKHFNEPGKYATLIRFFDQLQFSIGR